MLELRQFCVCSLAMAAFQKLERCDSQGSYGANIGDEDLLAALNGMAGESWEDDQNMDASPWPAIDCSSENPDSPTDDIVHMDVARGIETSWIENVGDDQLFSLLSHMTFGATTDPKAINPGADMQGQASAEDEQWTCDAVWQEKCCELRDEVRECEEKAKSVKDSMLGELLQIKQRRDRQQRENIILQERQVAAERLMRKQLEQVTLDRHSLRDRIGAEARALEDGKDEAAESLARLRECAAELQQDLKHGESLHDSIRESLKASALKREHLAAELRGFGGELLEDRSACDAERIALEREAQELQAQASSKGPWWTEEHGVASTRRAKLERLCRVQDESIKALRSELEMQGRCEYLYKNKLAQKAHVQVAEFGQEVDGLRAELAECDAKYVAAYTSLEAKRCEIRVVSSLRARLSEEEAAFERQSQSRAEAGNAVSEARQKACDAAVELEAEESNLVVRRRAARNSVATRQEELERLRLENEALLRQLHGWGCCCRRAAPRAVSSLSVDAGLGPSGAVV